MRTTPPFRPSARLYEAGRVAALCLVVFSTWATVFDKWTPASFTRPIGYVLDGMYVLGTMKAGADSAVVPFLSKEVPRLGAPYVANWNDFPASDDQIYFLWGQVGRVIGVVTALNLAHLTYALAAAVALYLVARWLRIRWEAAFVAGALYGLSPFLFYRSVHHFSLVNYWHVPLLVPLAMWIASRRPLDLKSKRFRYSLGIAALAAISNVYYVNYALQLMGLAVLTQLFRKRWRAALPGVLIIGATIALFLATNLDTILYQAKNGPNPAAAHRAVAEVEVYALRPLELFHPGPRHRIDAFAAAAERHKANALAIGEFPGMYLGMVGGLGFLWLMLATMRGVLLSRRPGFGRFGLFSAWLVYVAIDGGLMHQLQVLTGKVMFRSNNRVSIFLMMFALLFFARLLAAIPRRVPRPVFIAGCAAVLALGAYDQTPSYRIDPNVPHWETVVQREKVAAADEKLVAQVEAKLPPHSMVFQLPPMQFPEAGFLGRTPDYDQFRPYLFSKTLRFSYGNMKGRPEANWQNQMASMPIPQLVPELVRQGFGAIYVLRTSYPPQAVAQLIAQVQQQGGELVESEYGDSFFLLLKPQG